MPVLVHRHGCVRPTERRRQANADRPASAAEIDWPFKSQSQMPFSEGAIFVSLTWTAAIGASRDAFGNRGTTQKMDPQLCILHGACLTRACNISSLVLVFRYEADTQRIGGNLTNCGLKAEEQTRALAMLLKPIINPSNTTISISHASLSFPRNTLPVIKTVLDDTQ